MKHLSFILGFLIMSFNINAGEIDSLLVKLDKSISERQYYTQKKEDKLSDLKHFLEQTDSLEEQYTISKQIMEEYSYYISDSALYYSRKCIDLSKKLNNGNYQLDMQLKRAFLLSFPELFHESFKILESIDPEKLSTSYKANYYQTYILVYHNQIKDLNTPFYREMYRKEIDKYVNLYLSLGEQNKAQHLTILAYKHYVEGNYEAAADVVKELLSKPDISPYMHAEFLYNLGGLYMEAGNKYKYEAKKNLILASIESNELAITKNPPLLYLAMMLTEEKDTDRAYRYMNITMDEADTFSNRHRHSITKKTHFSIQDAYYNKIENQKKALREYAVMITCLCLIIGAFFIYIFQRNRVLRRTRKELSGAIESLRESNYVKETYISHYLNQYSSYIDKLNEYKTFILRKLNTGQHQELIKSEANFAVKAKKEIDTLFEDFDKTFLELYPNFIAEINALLTEENYFVLKTDQHKKPKLNAEIRILALIRLGISDNKTIASFLRFTVQTVYNYRSKIKAKAINEETFEKCIKKIDQ